MYILPELTVDEIIIYLRKSRTDDPALTVEETLSKHEQMLDEWIERNIPGKARVPESNRFREVVSGETIDSRPAVKEVLRRVESQKFKAVLIVDPQRLSRGDLEDIGRLVKLLRYSNTIVITLPFTYDLRDERDRDAFERELKRGNEFLEYQKKILNNGRLLSVQNGNYIGQHAPYGYRKVLVRDGKKKCHTLEPHPDEAPIVKLIFQKYNDGIGMNRISDELLSMGVTPPAGNKYWARTTLRGILTNEHYLGKVRWLRKKTVRTVQNGAVIERRPTAEEYLIYPGKHEPIIEQEIWDGVQKRLGTMPRNNKAGTLRSPLAGLLYCKVCDRAMARHEYFETVNGERIERAAARFACRHQKHCGTPSCQVSEVLEQVSNTLRETIEDFEFRTKSKKDDSIDVHRQMIARLEKRLVELENLEATQWEKYTLEGMPKNVFEKLNKKVLDEKEEVQQLLCTAKDSIPEPINLEERLVVFRSALEMLNDPNARVQELNDLLKECIERIDYSREPAPGLAARWKTGNPFVLDVKLKVNPVSTH